MQPAALISVQDDGAALGAKQLNEAQLFITVTEALDSSSETSAIFGTKSTPGQAGF